MDFEPTLSRNPNYGHQLTNIKPSRRGLQQKLAELRQERGEHELVAETLKKAEPERKAWRLVGKRRLYRTYISSCVLFQIFKYLFVIIMFQVVF